jgi:hypothetical protein
MNINETILSSMANRDQYAIDLFAEYGCSRAEIEDFLFKHRNFEDRQQKAIDIIEGILTYHGKEDLLKNLTELARIEHAIIELEARFRDHVVHALNSFILGIYINESWMTQKANRFQWKLAGLLHDVAYPAEIAHSILGSLPRTLNRTAEELGFPLHRIGYGARLDGLEQLLNGINALDLIQKRIDEWDLQINVHDEYLQTVREGIPCHGMYTGLCVLWVLDMMYEKNNPGRRHEDIRAVMPYLSWNQQYFERDIVSACAAIFIHNLPPRCFLNAKISRENSPLAFLLRLSDELQDWERPSRQNPDGEPSTNFDIENDQGILTLRTLISEEKKQKMREIIYSTLVVPNVKIL